MGIFCIMSGNSYTGNKHLGFYAQLLISDWCLTSIGLEGKLRGEGA